MADLSWRELEVELDAWSEEGQAATLWWRDDDARGPSPELERLLRIQSRTRVPLSLAVIPERLDPALARLLQEGREVAVLQHGFAHRNHAGAGEKSMELGSHRPREHVLDEVRLGFERLQSTFGDRFLPVLVPPWNRIAAGVLPFLPRCGLRGLSTFAPRKRADPVPGLREVNTHVDVIDWRGGRRGRERRVLIPEVAGHLRARREGRVDAEEATGVLTHHLDHDEGAWTFVEELLERVSAHPSASWRCARALFPDRSAELRPE